MISQRGVWVESVSRQAVSEELLALGKLPSASELSALIERYAGSTRVSCEQADLFFASIGEVALPGPRSAAAAPADAAEVARGSWLDKLGARSSAPPRVASVAPEEPALSMSPPPVAAADEPITIEQGLSHLPAATYSSAPPPNALPRADTPVALPLSSRPAPQLTAAESVVVERWGLAETSPEPALEEAAPTAALISAEEDELLDRWSDALDETISDRADAIAKQPSSAPPPPLDSERQGSTDAPERWSAPHLGGEVEQSQSPASDDDAPLSAAELSLLERWSGTDAPPPASAPPAKISSRAPARSQLPPIPSSLRPGARSQPAVVAHDASEADAEIEEEIELDPDDLIEDDSE